MHRFLITKINQYNCVPIQSGGDFNQKRLTCIWMLLKYIDVALSECPDEWGGGGYAINKSGLLEYCTTWWLNHGQLIKRTPYFHMVYESAMAELLSVLSHLSGFESWPAVSICQMSGNAFIFYNAQNCCVINGEMVKLYSDLYAF